MKTAYPTLPVRTWPLAALLLATLPVVLPAQVPQQPAPQPAGGQAVVNSLRMQFVLVPPGEFLMGSAPEEIERLAAAASSQQRAEIYRSEGPQHRVRITRPFYLGRTPVTVAEFRAFVEASGYRTEAQRDGQGGFGMIDRKWVRHPKFVWDSGPGFEQTDDHPVVNVSWNDAVAFCDWLSKQEGAAYRLPTEAQWEYACRAGTETPWHFGDDPSQLDHYAWHRGNSQWRIHPVARRRPNALGLYDMQGNVRNWCSDWYAADYYAASPPDDPVGPAAGTHRIVRGSAFHYYPDFARSAMRFRDPPSHRHGQIGFRVLRAVD